MQKRKLTSAIAVMVLVAALGACAKKTPPVARPVPPPPTTTDPNATATRPPTPPTPVPEPQPIPPEPTLSSSDIGSKDIDDINRNSPFQPVFYLLDQFEVDSAAQQALNSNAEILKKYPSWVITIEGHADERGTAEYNLALGERRALAARNYLVSLGIPADRLRTVSYGKEFPFDPGHTEASWSKNRRAHFVVTSK
jgi:peptidoglycan-associated lipoprotein